MQEWFLISARLPSLFLLPLPSLLCLIFFFILNYPAGTCAIHDWTWICLSWNIFHCFSSFGKGECKLRACQVRTCSVNKYYSAHSIHTNNNTLILAFTLRFLQKLCSYVFKILHVFITDVASLLFFRNVHMRFSFTSIAIIISTV